MRNEDDISLEKGERIGIIENFEFKVADSIEGDVLRFYPFVEYIKENTEIEWKISPKNPVAGDTIILSGTASPDETAGLEISLEKEVPVVEGKYYYEIEEVKIPKGENNLFTARAEGVQDLNVRVKKLIWISIFNDATDGVAIISQGHVPSWTYDKIRIDGQAENGTENVTLKFTASETVRSDSSGNFNISYNTSYLPPGEYQIKLGGNSKTITLKAQDENSSWNPWISPTSEEGEKISTTELQEAIYCWLNNEAAPETGVEITTERLQEIIYQWQEAEEV